MSTSIQHHYLDLNGVRMHYLEGGTPGAPPLLMVHGLTREAHSFDPVFALLGERYRCLAIDVRGRGQSAWSPPATYNIPQYTQDVEALLEALKLETVAYLGTSMGGLIGMALAERQPQRFNRLALNDIGPEVASGGSVRIQTHLANIPVRFASYPEALAYEITRYPWLADRSRQDVEAQYRYMIVKEEDGCCRFHYDPNIQLGRANSAEDRQRQQERSWRGFKALECPLLLIRGAETDLLAQETVSAMLASQPHMQVAEIPGVGHAPALTEPEARAALSEFFMG